MGCLADTYLGENERFSAMCLAVASYDLALEVGQAAPAVWSTLS